MRTLVDWGFKLVTVGLIVLIIWGCMMTESERNSPVVEAGSRKIKIYIDAPSHYHNDEFVPYVMTNMNDSDFENPDFEYEWIERATDADFIFAIIADKNKLPVAVKTAPNVVNMCYQFIVTTHLWKKGSKKTHDMLGQHVNCDPDDMAKTIVVELETAIGIRKRVMAAGQ